MHSGRGAGASPLTPSVLLTVRFLSPPIQCRAAVLSQAGIHPLACYSAPTCFGDPVLLSVCCFGGSELDDAVLALH